MLTENQIIERSLTPRFAGPITHSLKGRACGDVAGLRVLIDSGIIVGATHEVTGCCLTRAVADVLCERLMGLSIHEAGNLRPADCVGFPVPLTRQGCLTLPFEVLKAVLNDSENK